VVLPEVLFATGLLGIFCVAVAMTYPRANGAAPILKNKTQNIVADSNLQIAPESFGAPPPATPNK
jgi:hypothetical protein